MFNQTLYEAQVLLLLRCLPSVATEPCFAIKGGSAINLFIRDLPRLSVDIDLVYLPLQGRDESLDGIEKGLIRIKEKLEDKHQDLRIMTQHNKETKSIKAFLIYLASNSRPMHELLEPNRLDHKRIYQNEFVGMTSMVVSYEDLQETLEALIILLKKILNADDKEFLLSIKHGKPNWDKIGLSHINQLPGIQWKLLNINRMDKVKHRLALQKLEKSLN